MMKSRLPYLLAGTLALFLATPAQAAPGNDWTLISVENVRYFLPGTTPPANSTQATGSDAAALAAPLTPDPNEWILVETKRISEFIPDAETNAQVIATRVERVTPETNPVVLPPQAKVYHQPSYVRTNTLSKKVTTSSNGDLVIESPIVEQTVRPYSQLIQTRIDTATRTVTRETRRVDRTTRTATGQEIVITRTWDAWVETRSPQTGYNQGSIDPKRDKSQFGLDLDAPRTRTVSSTLSSTAADTRTKRARQVLSTFGSEHSASAKAVPLGGTKTVSTVGAGSVSASKGKKATSGGGSVKRGNQNERDHDRD